MFITMIIARKDAVDYKKRCSREYCCTHCTEASYSSCSLHSSFLSSSSCHPSPPPDYTGVMGIDVTTCDLEFKLYEANPDIQKQPEWPEETKVANCKCAEKFVYDGDEYFGCTMADWPVPWCGTVGCGIQAATVTDTGWWADCKPYGVRAELETLLKQSGEECGKNLITECQIEALRKEGNKCDRAGSTCPSAELKSEEAANYFDGLPGVDYRSDTSDASWASNADSATFDSAIWSDSGDTCPHCENEQMRPQCALPKSCGKSLIPQIQQFLDSDSAETLSATRLWALLLTLVLAVTAARMQW